MNITNWIRGGCLTAAVLLAGACAEPPPGADVAFEHVTVIDAAGGVRGDQRVVVSGEQIVSVAPMAAPAPSADRVIDGRGRYLIPGLWDMHVHFLYDDSLTEAMAELFLAYGITSVRDTGGNVEKLAALRSRLEASADPAPRIFFSGPLLDGEHVVYDGGDPGRPPLGTAVAAQADADSTVAELVSAGADFIKIYELVTPDVFEALVTAARQRGLPIAAHVPLTMTADQAGPQVDSMEHLRNVELACAENWQALLDARRERIAGFDGDRGYPLRSQIHDNQRLPAIAAYDETRCDSVLGALGQTTQVPTLRLNAFNLVRPYERPDWSQALSELPGAVAERWAGEVDAHRAQAALADTTFAEWSLFLAGRMHQAGVPLGAGTDTPITQAIPGYSLHTELALLVRSGLTPMQALEAATLAPARFFGLQGEMGRIDPGQVADLVLLDADPLADIGNTRRIHGVMARGRWLPAAEPAAE